MDCRVKTRNILLSDFLQIPVSILDLMDCRVKTWLMPISGENLSIVSILDLMDCRVKTGWTFRVRNEKQVSILDLMDCRVKTLIMFYSFFDFFSFNP